MKLERIHSGVTKFGSDSPYQNMVQQKLNI